MKLNTLIEKASQCQGRTVAVAAAEDEEVIEVVAMALEHRLDRFVLYGDRERIGRLLKEKGGRVLPMSISFTPIRSPKRPNWRCAPFI